MMTYWVAQYSGIINPHKKRRLFRGFPRLFNHRRGGLSQNCFRQFILENSRYVRGNVGNLHISTLHPNINDSCNFYTNYRKETAWHTDNVKNSLTTYVLIAVALLFSRLINFFNYQVLHIPHWRLSEPSHGNQSRFISLSSPYR